MWVKLMIITEEEIRTTMVKNIHDFNEVLKNNRTVMLDTEEDLDFNDMKEILTWVKYTQKSVQNYIIADQICIMYFKKLGLHEEAELYRGLYDL